MPERISYVRAFLIAEMLFLQTSMMTGTAGLAVIGVFSVGHSSSSSSSEFI